MSPASDRTRQRSVARTAGIPRRVARRPATGQAIPQTQAPAWPFYHGLSDCTAGKRSFVAGVMASGGIELTPCPGTSSHAERTARAWSVAGMPLLDISVFAVFGLPLEVLLRHRFASFRTIYLPTAGELGKHGFELMATARRPHFTVRLERADDRELARDCWLRSGPPGPIPSTLGLMSGERRAEIYRVDITADLNDEDHTGYLWTFLDEARDPAQITPGALVVAGDEDAAAVCQVIDLVPAVDGTIVHLRPLPGLVDDYRALVERALAS